MTNVASWLSYEIYKYLTLCLFWTLAVESSLRQLTPLKSGNDPGNEVGFLSKVIMLTHKFKKHHISWHKMVLSDLSQNKCYTASPATWYSFNVVRCSFKSFLEPILKSSMLNNSKQLTSCVLSPQLLNAKKTDRTLSNSRGSGKLNILKRSWPAVTLLLLMTTSRQLVTQPKVGPLSSTSKRSVRYTLWDKRDSTNNGIETHPKW